MQIFTQEQVCAFRKARFSERAHASQANLPIGPLRIKFFTAAFNAFYRRTECLFYVYAVDDETPIGTYYQNALIDFQE